MYWGCIGQCIRNVSWVYYECNNLVSLMYYWCIRTCTLQWAYTPVFLHTLAITSLGPSPAGHPVFGISSPWVCHAGSWGVGAATAWQHQTCFLQAGHAHSSMPSWVLCSRNHSWAGCRHPDGAPKVEAPDLTYWAAVEGQTGHKQQWKVPVKSQRRT